MLHQVSSQKEEEEEEEEEEGEEGEEGEEEEAAVRWLGGDHVSGRCFFLSLFCFLSSLCHVFLTVCHYSFNIGWRAFFCFRPHQKTTRRNISLFGSHSIFFS